MSKCSYFPQSIPPAREPGRVSQLPPTQTPHTGGSISLIAYAESYALTCGASQGYREQLIVLTRQMNWNVIDLTVPNIDAYLTAALHRLAASTVDNHRRMLGTLRRAAIREGLLVDECTRPIRRVKHFLPIVRAWTHSELRLLLSVAADMPGGTLSCQYCVLLPAWIAVGYSSGLRLGDLLALRHESIRGERIALVLHKTSQPHVVVLDTAAIEAIKTLPRQGPKVFGGLIGRSQIIVVMRRLVKLAGLEGSGKYLRRSSATYAQMAGIDATGHLGHRTPAMKLRYLDPVIMSDLKIAVPSIS